MDILRHAVAKSRHNFTSRTGLMVPATLLDRLGLGETVDELMPAPGSSRGYRHGAIFKTFMLTSREGAKCLEDVRHLHGEHSLTWLMGFRSLPCAGGGTAEPGPGSGQCPLESTGAPGHWRARSGPAPRNGKELQGRAPPPARRRPPGALRR